MKAGKYRHRVTFQKKVTTQNPATGGDVVTWEDEHEDVPAHVSPLSGKELMAAQANQSEVVGRVEIRYRTDIDPTMRMTHRGKILSIHAILPDNESGLQWLTIPYSEGVKDD